MPLDIKRLKRLMNLKPLHRQTIFRLMVSLLVLVILNHINSHAFEHGSPSKALTLLLDSLPSLPTLAMIIILGRYLARETDEFIRMIVVQALLWGAAVDVVGVTILSALGEWEPEVWSIDHGAMASTHFFFFYVTFGIVLIIKLWRNR
jgi:hypothetical protein